ncbi:hypothetical protein HLB44_04280 [Aquincola sp. S2]|uniref:ABC transporter substrate-binding protein n=1 Tax=Pseudaquabacterium terrae TaxID=2732868 RepID=A0ABX2EDE6_9BURK|nr:ABC transporter substrate binding protein [Aquabacterium terrae]NRF66193.1 hypothetical protein [Aquabacterium terrae]
MDGDLSMAAKGRQFEYANIGTDIDRWDAAYASLARKPATVLVPGISRFMVQHGPLMASLERRHRLPTIYAYGSCVSAGGLCSYGASQLHIHDRLAHLLARIFEGARPDSLPIEQPSKFELVLNLKTASAIGVTVPQALRLRADQVIQ